MPFLKEFSGEQGSIQEIKKKGGRGGRGAQELSRPAYESNFVWGLNTKNINM